MKIKLRILVFATILFAAAHQVNSQGYIVPNGITYAGTSLGPPGYGITVTYNPTNGYSTGFTLNPVGKTQPTIYTNTYQFNPIVDVGVRVFLLSANQPVTQEAIQSGSYTELMLLNDYVFNHNSPFYVGLYTGNQNFYPPNGIYNDPLFGWARLVNNQGVIQLLDSAIAYKAEGIFAGTQTIIPEPTSFALVILSGALLGIRRCKRLSL